MKDHPYYDSQSKKDSFAIAVFCVICLLVLVGILGLAQLFL